MQSRAGDSLGRRHQTAAGGITSRGTPGEAQDPPRGGSLSTGKGPLKAAYLILGDDEPKVEKALRRLKMRIGQAVTGDVGDLNVDEFQAASGNSVEVVNAANTMAFLDGLRLVLVHAVHVWRKEDKDRVVAYLRSPAPDACLALIGEKLAPTDPLRAAVAAVGDVLEFAAPRKAKFAEWVAKQAVRLSLEMGPEEVRLLIERMGEHQHLVLRELEKLSAYAGPGRVTTDDIEAVCSHTLEASVFELVDALAGGEGAQAFRALEELYAAGEDPSGLFYRVLWHFEKLIAVIALRGGGATLDQVQERLKLKQFPAKKLWRQSEVIGPEHGRMIVRALSRADARMKGMSPLPSEVAAGLEFELCLGAILTARRG